MVVAGSTYLLMSGSRLCNHVRVDANILADRHGSMDRNLRHE